MSNGDKKNWKTNDSVNEEHLLQKLKGLRFYDPDNNVMYKVSKKNLE